MWLGNDIQRAVVEREERSAPQEDFLRAHPAGLSGHVTEGGILPPYRGVAMSRRDTPKAKHSNRLLTFGFKQLPTCWHNRSDISGASAMRF